MISETNITSYTMGNVKVNKQIKPDTSISEYDKYQ